MYAVLQLIIYKHNTPYTIAIGQEIFTKQKINCLIITRSLCISRDDFVVMVARSNGMVGGS